MPSNRNYSTLISSSHHRTSSSSSNATDHSETASMRRRKSGSGKHVGPGGSASWLSSVINLLNTIVGAGVLAMPLAMSHMGMLLGILVILWSGLTAAFGLYLQTRCARYLERGTASFFALSQLTYPNAAVVFDAAIAIKCFGVGISYLIIIGGLMPGVVAGLAPDAQGFWVDRQFWVTAFMLVVIPLSFLRRLDSLKYTSMIALVSIGYLVILVLAHYFRGDTVAPRSAISFLRWTSPQAALSSFPVIVFAYTCHQNMFSVVNEIRDPSPRSTLSVITSSIGSASSIYLLVAIIGYLSFGNKVLGNIMEMYASNTPASTVGKAAIVILVTFSYPLQCHPCRASVDAVLNWRPQPSSSSSSSEPPSSSASTTRAPPAAIGASSSPSHSPSQHSQPLVPSRSKERPGLPTSTSLPTPRRKMGDMGETRFAIITCIILLLSYAIAMSVTSLEKVLAYVGSTGSTSISFVLPGLFYYKISDPAGGARQRLVKDDDDDDDDSSESGSEDGSDDGEVEEGEEGLLGRRKKRRRKAWWRRFRLRDEWVRTASLALAVYGVVVMITCLVTNTIFAVAAH